MIDYVGRATTTAVRIKKSTDETAFSIAKTILTLFPIVFTAVYFLAAVFEAASQR